MVFLKSKLNIGWTFVVPDFNKKHRVNIFPEGQERYMDYDNTWVIFGEWKGKVALVNVQDPTIVIQSISAWKVSEVLHQSNGLN